MKNIPALLSAHIALATTTLATCWKLKRRDAVVMGFTDHDQPLVVDGVSYLAATGFSPSAVENNAGLAVDNLEVEGMLSSGAISEEDILAGIYDAAEIRVFLVNAADTSQGTIPLRRGWLGKVQLSDGKFVAELRGLAQALSTQVGELFSPSCRATLGDARCGVNLAAHTVTGSITTVLSRLEFIDSARTEASSIFTGGVITFTSGANDGLAMEVKEYTKLAAGGGRITLALPLPAALGTGQNYSLSKGCDKTTATCQARFANIANFRGEPHVPGLDKMLETAGTRS